MNRKCQLLLSCTLLGFPAVANAFQSNPLGTIEDINLEAWTRTWPLDANDDPLPTTNIGRAVSGDFSGDLTPDVWQHTSTHLILFLDPSYMDCTVEVDKATGSIARLPGPTPTSKDRLLVSDDVGLSTVEYTMDLDTGAWTISVNPLTPNFSTWANAKSLSCPDLDLDGDYDLLAINAVGTKVLRLIHDGSGGYTAAPNINVGTGASETFALMYVVGENVLPQVAILTSSWFSVADFNGVRTRLIAVPNAPNPFGHIAKITQAPVGTTHYVDCIAWLHDDGGQQVRLIDSTGSEQAPLELGDLDVSAIFSGDRNADGNDELGLSTKDRADPEDRKIVIRYDNQRNEQNPTGARFSIVDPPYAFYIDGAVSSGAVNTSTPLLVDLNFDRKADLFAVDRDDPQALSILTDPPPGPEEVEYSMSMENEPGHPCFHLADFYTATYVEPNCGDVTSSSTGVLMLELKNPWNIATADNNDYIVDLVMYRQEFGDVQTNSSAVQHYQYDLADDYLPTGGGSWAFPIRINSNEDTFLHKYYIVVRAVPTGGGPPLTEFVVGFTSDYFELDPPEPELPGWVGSLPYLVQRPGSWGASIPYFLHDVATGCFGGNDRFKVSGAVPLLRIPRFPGPPNPGTPNNPGPPQAP